MSPATGARTQYVNTPFYFPHSLDFRGRAYPIPPHLNHVGSDLCRGLLLFVDGQPLGERGLFWLKVHLANLMGQDKYANVCVGVCASHCV